MKEEEKGVNSVLLSWLLPWAVRLPPAGDPAK